MSKIRKSESFYFFLFAFYLRLFSSISTYNKYPLSLYLLAPFITKMRFYGTNNRKLLPLLWAYKTENFCTSFVFWKLRCCIHTFLLHATVLSLKRKHQTYDNKQTGSPFVYNTIFLVYSNYIIKCLRLTVYRYQKQSMEKKKRNTNVDVLNRYLKKLLNIYNNKKKIMWHI